MCALAWHTAHHARVAARLLNQTCERVGAGEAHAEGSCALTTRASAPSSARLARIRPALAPASTGSWLAEVAVRFHTGSLVQEPRATQKSAGGTSDGNARHARRARRFAMSAPSGGGAGLAVGAPAPRATEPLITPEALSSSAPVLGDSVGYTPPVPAMPKPQSKWLDKRVSGGGNGAARLSFGSEAFARPPAVHAELGALHAPHAHDLRTPAAGAGHQGSVPASHFYPRVSRGGNSSGGGWSRGDDRARCLRSNAPRAAHPRPAWLAPARRARPHARAAHARPRCAHARGVVRRVQP